MGNRSAADAGGLLAGRGPGTGTPGSGAALGAAGAAALVGGVLLIGVVLAGNSLVCVSVASERSLQTPTNYFIVSLAAADLLLALLVLPLFVYSEVSLRPRLLLRPVPVPAEPLSTQVASLIRNIEWQQTVAGAPDLLAPWSSAVLGPLESLLLLLSVPLCLSSPLPLSTCLGFCHPEAPVFGAGDSRNWRLGQTPPSPQPDSPPLHSEEPAGQTTRWGLSPAQYPQGARTHRCLRPSTPHRRPPRALVNQAWGPPGAVSWTGQRIQGEAGGRGRTPVHGGTWLLSPRLCDALMAMDVMLCTASIFNLCAISVDRFVAVTVPLRYHRQGRRQLLLIGATWLLSAAVAAPVLCGLNDARGRDPAVCRLEDRDYVVYSSVCSFFLPCPLMLLLYWATFRGLRRWGAARRAKLHARAPRRPSGPGPPPASSLPPGPCGPDCPVPGPVLHRVSCGPGCPPLDAIPEAELSPQPLTQAHQRRAKITSRERKAMRVLPVVVGAFLVCWTPFFVVHITGALCRACFVPPRLVSAVTWLGYVNSALNPLIYTVFNTEFRSVFRKALRPSGRAPGPCCASD
ncbi:D(4) dopamine receptor isoform X2 [Marmota monax]|uniref:D(4) dopamine receptor isoform X2 n=1 Tax=Marmota monax TaxID=9995 RepID=UPI001EAFFED7|nr:D(4) dopamine receptor isoform X2 [Marmota monax]